MNLLLNQFAHTPWHHWPLRHRPSLLIYFFYYGSATQTVKEFPYPLLTNGQCCDHVLTHKDELALLAKRAWEKFNKDSSFVLTFMKNMRELNQQHQQKWRKLLKTDFSGYDKEKLFKKYYGYINDLLAHATTTYLPLCMENILTEECHKRLTTEQVNSVMTPIIESEVIEERKSLLWLAKRRKQKKSIVLDMKKHVERFSYLKRKDCFMEFYNDADYERKMQEYNEPKKELAALEAETRHKKAAFQKVLDAFKKDSFAQNLFKTTNEAIFFRTWRTERYSQSTFYVRPLFAEIAHRLKLEAPTDVIWLLPPEVEELLQKNKSADRQLISQRKEAFTFITFGPEQILILQGKDATDSSKYLKIAETNSAEIKGTPAFQGKVTGKVTLIHDRTEWPRIEKAEVLVIHATTPDIVPFLKNVKAIVTEEGGILSHASVISRELKIPCVIGTLTATKVLKDGDVVEVDVENGTVRICE